MATPTPGGQEIFRSVSGYAREDLDGPGGVPPRRRGPQHRDDAHRAPRPRVPALLDVSDARVVEGFEIDGPFHGVDRDVVARLDALPEPRRLGEEHHVGHALVGPARGEAELVRQTVEVDLVVLDEVARRHVRMARRDARDGLDGREERRD